MRYEEWEGIYREILRDFGFSEEEDLRAARALNRLLEAQGDPPSLSALEEEIRGRRVNVYGAGPSLEALREFPPGFQIPADGATSFFRERGGRPDLIVTDLDGRVEDQIEAARERSRVVIHAHGDNLPRLLRYVPAFPPCFGTTQTRPFGRLHNFGGFTDGDRAVFLAEHLGAREIALYGMDFHGGVGRYSFKEGGPIKRKKLLWAERLIRQRIEESEAEIYFGETDG
jgi:hypothetical protein